MTAPDEQLPTVAGTAEPTGPRDPEALEAYAEQAGTDPSPQDVAAYLEMTGAEPDTPAGGGSA